MRISFLGKGGSGKTTLAAGYIQHMSQFGPVLAIDADINVHLGNTLGMRETPKEIGHDFERIAAYVQGDRSDIDQAHMVATTPPSLHSRFIRLTEDDPFLKQYADQKGTIRLLTIGSYRDCDIGHTCYHGKLNVLELLYHHLLDKKSDRMVADVTAGIDNLGTSLFFAYDLNVFVVEPTIKSINVYLEFEKVSKVHHLPTKVIINKTSHPKDISFVHRYIDPQNILGVVFLDEDVRLLEQGDAQALGRFVLSHEMIFSRIEKEVQVLEKDWHRYYDLLLQTHQKNSLEWWNEYYHQPIDTQRDPQFCYTKVL